MNVTALADALADLDSSDQGRVQSQLQTWIRGSDDKWQRIARNIEQETALSRLALGVLLGDFARRLESGEPPEDAWIGACRERSQLAGKALGTDPPRVIGRALTIKQYATFLEQDTGLSRKKAEALLQRAIREGTNMSARLRRTLERTRVGRFIVWATFDETDADRHPYSNHPHRTDHICVAFGLGHCSLVDPLVLIAYGTQRPMLELKRPTIADAADYPWYRPHPDPDHAHGWTEPLPPNPNGLPSQPEVVHAETTANDLVLPLYCTS